MFDCKNFRKVMDESGLTKSELAGLFGASRQTMYAWRDHAPQQRTLAERAEKYTNGLLAAIQRNLLPLPATLTPAQRKHLLLKMAQQLHKLTAPK